MQLIKPNLTLELTHQKNLAINLQIHIIEFEIVFFQIFFS